MTKFINNQYLIKGAIFVISTYLGNVGLNNIYYSMYNMSRHNIQRNTRINIGIISGIYSSAILIGGSYISIFGSFSHGDLKNIYYTSFCLNLFAYILLPKGAKYSLLNY
jgi:hypothetical protein